MTKISEIGGERELIKRIQKKIKINNNEVILGIGDDAAIIKPSKNKNIVLTTDMMVENIHFSLSYYTAKQIGKKAAVSNISDIAAMGAIPKHMLISLAIPPSIDAEFIDRLYDGIISETRKHSINIIGGNITGAKVGSFTINIVLIGETDQEIRRSGAKPGEVLMVTGDLGKSGAGLYVLQNNTKISKTSKKSLIISHLEPSHRLKESIVLKNTSQVTSMIDISDGLAKEAKEIGDSSNVGIIIYKDKIPTSKATDELLKSIGRDTKESALYAGEDYELLFTAKEEDAGKIIAALKKHTGTKATVIGRITQDKGICIMDKNNNIEELSKTGYDHFRENLFDFKR